MGMTSTLTARPGMENSAPWRCHRPHPAVLGGLAEFEKELIRVRTEGREHAKARGVKLGRKPKMTEHPKREAIRRRDRDGETVREIARGYNVSHSTISRLCRPHQATAQVREVFRSFPYGRIVSIEVSRRGKKRRPGPLPARGSIL
jgi:hypothetical protein